MPAKKLKVAVIGAGMIANAGHIPAWKDQADVDVVGVADSSEENAAATARRHNIPHVYADAAAMIAELQPDIVSVCTPNRYHKEHTIAALKGGAHVLCEKPLAASLADAVEMFDAAAAAGRTLLVGQSLRFYNPIAAAKEFAASGELGEVYYAETSVFRRRGVPTWGRFHMKAHSGGGPLLDLGVHALDTVLWLMGNPKVVAASGMTCTKLANRDEGLITSLAASGAPIGVFNPRPFDPAEFDVEDLAAGFLRLESGAAIIIRVSWAANVPEGAGGTMVLGTGGGLWLDPVTLGLKLVRNMGRYPVDITPKVPPPEPAVDFYGHWKLAAHLVRVLRGEEKLLVTREEALNVIGALEAIYKSAAERREVWLDAGERLVGTGGHS